ncbi:signal peptide, CUB and EGF-like domain-containing protein 2 isoform X2 [Chelonus insularis]|uniref:signal peptide, CUB and EGF-like domain-containing protein 2 isoform X2 n=1 Tax=Chelonus insularis TaxID=460826 RepID=UPI0015882C43|nr:signal peptide, CUB and EGF-like domain-containing protein 2 isoform X2 [Chelonus insularis]
MKKFIKPSKNLKKTLKPDILKRRLKKYKTRNYRKLKGESRHLVKGYKKRRLIDVKNQKHSPVSQSSNIKNVQVNVEKELTKNLEKEIVESKLLNFRNNWDNFNDQKIENDFLLDKNSYNWQNVQETTKFDVDYTIEGFSNGDISCIVGEFIPAPFVSHTLIKYIKSSQPEHIYLEANYQCMFGYSLASNSSKLVCKNRKWIGELPSCLDENLINSCNRLSCDHICIQVNRKATCSCHEGFNLSNNKCIDINECSFNNGHGPCQDTCKNFEGGYLCSCDKLPGTFLAADNHSCHEINSCTVNNAGCSHTCLSTIERVFCLCPDGFILKNDWKTCEDVDECLVPELQHHACKYGCINTPGSYYCINPVEYQPNRSPENKCPPGFKETSKSTCVDINECEENNGECSEVCENTNGSYFCTCNGDEQILALDGKSCTDINAISCLPLKPVKKGSLVCSRPNAHPVWSVLRTINRPGSKCYLKCPQGYQLLGGYEITCQQNGNWEGIKNGECIKSNEPRINCPKDIIAEVPPANNEAFVRFDQPSTDIDWFRYVRSNPSWGMRLEASLKPGYHVLTFFVKHSTSKIQSSCNLHITVKDGEPPKALNCPEDIVKNNRTLIIWIEPIFTDNVRVTRVTSNERPGRFFNVGEWKIIYEASDDAGWTSNCTFSVIIQ